jgi:4-amino-4-deoxy-L-arabinose transferase-like glycosyltransferase
LKSAPAKYAILFFSCVLFHLVGTWNLPLIDRDEPRFAEASREMLERGDFVVPHFNGNLRLDKPPLAYWAQVVSFKIFGENDFAARFPSAIAAALIALSILGWGTRIGGKKVGLWSAIIFTLSLQTFLHAKAAVADMWLVLFITLAQWAGWEMIGAKQAPNVGRPTSDAEWNWWPMFYVSLGLGFMAKGPIAWVPLLTVVSMVLCARDLKLARRFKFGRGILLTLAIVAMWGIPALIQTQGEFLSVGIGRHVIARSFGAMEGHGANSFGMYVLFLPFYFVTVFASFFPWSIKLPWLTKTLWRSRDSTDNYFIAGIAIIFIIFTLVKTKLPHYTLPALPLLALLLARHWAPREATHFRAIAITTAVGLILIALVFPPFFARSFPAYALLQQARDSLRPEMEFGAVDYNEPSLVWYFRSRVKSFLTPLKRKEAADFMARPGSRFLVMPTALADSLFQDHPSNWKSFSTHGFNIAKGKHVDLTLLIRPE